MCILEGVFRLPWITRVLSDQWHNTLVDSNPEQTTGEGKLHWRVCDFEGCMLTLAASCSSFFLVSVRWTTFLYHMLFPQCSCHSTGLKAMGPSDHGLKPRPKISPCFLWFFSDTLSNNKSVTSTEPTIWQSLLPPARDQVLMKYWGGCCSEVNRLEEGENAIHGGDEVREKDLCL